MNGVVQCIGSGLMRKLTVGFVLLACLLLALTIATGAWVLTVTPTEKRDRAKINSRGFEYMAANTPWNLEKEMLWGYFFTNKSRLPLGFLAEVLKLVGYRFVDVSFDDEKQFWWLHMERGEIQNLDSLSVRDVRLARFAKLVGFSDYDGWDVGPPKSP
jgi:hypothetical protein